MCLKEGDDLCLATSVSGDPEPKVKWLKDNMDVIEDYRTKTEGGKDGEFKFTIKNAKVRDSGRFSVTAKNRLGEVTSSADIAISPSER